MILGRRLLALSLAAAALVAIAGTEAMAQTATPIDIQAKLFLKICSYDENLPADLLRVGVAYPSADGETGSQITGTFRSLEKMKVNGRRIEAVAVAYAKPADIEAAVKTLTLYGLFVTAAASFADIAAVPDLAKKYRVFTFGQDDRFVAAGLIAGIATEGEKRVILLNMTAALEQGRKYDGNFIKACKVVR
jgi:hypothetical protein